jgi:hypothetical protein
MPRFPLSLSLALGNNHRIVEFFRNSRPVHRCSFDKLQNMLRSGAVLSLHCVETLLSDVQQMVDLVLTHPLVVPICQACPVGHR